MMQVIRCEHPSGRRASDGVANTGHNWCHLPTPGDEGGYYMDDDEVCAAPPDKVDEWFPDWVRPLLREQGFRFVVLDVPKDALCFTGAYQVVIKRELCVERGEFLQ